MSRKGSCSVSKKIKTQTKGDEVVICSKCGKSIAETDNFCSECGAKLNERCRHCWIRKKDNYSCGELSCPGYGLFSLLKSKTKGSLG